MAAWIPEFIALFVRTTLATASQRHQSVIKPLLKLMAKTVGNNSHHCTTSTHLLC